MLANSLALLAAALALARSSHGQDLGIETFLSRPNQTSARLTVQFNNKPSALAPGYIFLSPYKLNPPEYFGTQIHTMDGELVFSGQYLEQHRATDSHVCDYLGQDAICFTDGLPGPNGPGHSPGKDRFFDKNYKQLGKDFSATNGLVKPDSHELNTPVSLNGSGFIYDVFQPRQYDLTEYDGPKKGWILAGCFQQIDFQTLDLQFQWCSDDYVAFDQSYEYIIGNSAGNMSNGDKGTFHKPWDYFHINAIDRDHLGDYYVSSRSTRTVFKIAGPNSPSGKQSGDIIWRLGGKSNEFDYQVPVNFSQQHDVRVHSVEDDTTILSLFDNHYPLYPDVNPVNGSSAKWFQLNTTAMTVELVQWYVQPQNFYTGTGGQAQAFPNGNAFVGWGNLPSVSEHTHGNPGDAIYYATFSDLYSSYRSYKSDWVGEPSLPPDVYAFQPSCGSNNIAIYMSWNGATEYNGFNIFGHQNKGDSINQQQSLGSVQRAGYETNQNITSTKFHRYITVQATGGQGTVLGTSKPTKVVKCTNNNK